MQISRKTYIILFAVAAIAGLIYFFQSEPAPQYEIATVGRRNLIQEVSATGNVKPANELELAFEKTGKIAGIPVKIGDTVKSGQLLAYESAGEYLASHKQAQASLDKTKAQLKQYEAALLSEQAKLAEYVIGATPEEIKLAETKVSNAEKDISEAEKNLQNVEAQALADLNDDYSASLKASAYSMTIAENTLYAITDIQFKYFLGTGQKDFKFESEKAKMVESLFGKSGAGRYSKDELAKLSGGAKAVLAGAEANPTNENINNNLNIIIASLKVVRDGLINLPITDLTSADISSLNAEKIKIDTELSTLNAKSQAIKTQKAANETALSTAQVKLTTAKNALATAQAELAVEKAGYTDEQIDSQKAKVKQAEANLNAQQAEVKSAEANVSYYAAQLGGTVIRAPIDGIITDIKYGTGEIAGANSVVINLISANMFEIEANVAEVDIADIKLGDSASVTLDAYGSEKKFSAKLVKIDPAETLIDNVPTYKTTFQFNEDDQTIKSGMTANLDILVAEKSNALGVPSRAIIKQNNKKILRKLNPGGRGYSEVEVLIGLRSSDGFVEIISGINEGDTIVVSVKEKK